VRSVTLDGQSVSRERDAVSEASRGSRDLPSLKLEGLEQSTGAALAEAPIRPAQREIFSSRGFSGDGDEGFGGDSWRRSKQPGEWMASSRSASRAASGSEMGAFRGSICTSTGTFGADSVADTLPAQKSCVPSQEPRFAPLKDSFARRGMGPEFPRAHTGSPVSHGAQHSPVSLDDDRVPVPQCSAEDPIGSGSAGPSDTDLGARGSSSSALSGSSSASGSEEIFFFFSAGRFCSSSAKAALREKGVVWREPVGMYISHVVHGTLSDAGQLEDSPPAGERVALESGNVSGGGDADSRLWVTQRERDDAFAQNSSSYFFEAEL